MASESTLGLLFRINADAKPAQAELLNVQRAVQTMVRESGAELNKFGAGLDGGGIRTRLLAGLGNVREFFKGFAEGARQELESEGGFAGVLRRTFSERTAQAAGDTKRNLGGIAESLNNLQSGFAGGLPGLVDDFARRLQKAGDEGKGLSSAIPPATLATGVFAGAVIGAGAALVKAALNASEFVGKLQDVHDSLGVDVRLLGQLEAAGSVVGVSFDAIARSISTFQSKLDDAAGGNKKLSAEFRALGIEAKKAADDLQGSYLQLLKSLEGVENQAQRTALAKQLLGKAGADTLRISGELIDSNGKLRKEYEDLANVLTGENVAALDTLGDEWARFQVRAKTALVSITAQYAPDLILALRDISNEFSSAQDASGSFGSAASNFIGDVVVAIREAKFELGLLKAGLTNPDIGAGLKQLGQALVGNTAEIRQQYAEERKKLVEELRQQAGDGSDKKTPRIPIPKAGRGGGQDEAARNRLRQLEDDLKEEESILRLGNEALRRQFEQRAIDEAEYVERLIRAAELRRSLALDALQEERATVQNSKLKRADKAKELEAIGRRENEIERATAAEKEQISAESNKRTDQQAKELNDALVATERAGLARQRAALEAAAADRALSYEAAERAISAIADREMRLRITAAEAEVANARENSAEKAIAQEKVNALIEEGRALEEASLRRIGEARQKDVAALREYVETQKRLRDQLKEAEAEALKRRADNLEQRAQNQPAFRDDAIKAREEAEQEALSLSHERALRRIADERAEQLSKIDTANVTAETLARILETERSFNELRLAEERRFQEESQSSRVQSRTAELSLTFDPAAAQAIAEMEVALERQLTLWERNQVAAQSYAQTLQAAAATAWARATDLAGNFQRALTRGIDTFVQSGGSLKAAGKAIAQALAQPFIEAAKTEASFQAAKALAAAAIGDFRAATLHGLAAAGFAALAAIGTSLTSGGLGGAGASADNSAGRELQRDTERRRDPEESKFRFGDATGKLNQPDGADRPSFIEFALQRMRESQERQERLIEEARALQAAQLAATQGVQASTDALATRITAMEPEQVLGIGVERAPGLVAKGVKDSLIGDAGFTRTIAENLRLT